MAIVTDFGYYAGEHIVLEVEVDDETDVSGWDMMFEQRRGPVAILKQTGFGIEPVIGTLTKVRVTLQSTDTPKLIGESAWALYRIDDDAEACLGLGAVTVTKTALVERAPIPWEVS